MAQDSTWLPALCILSPLIMSLFHLCRWKELGNLCPVATGTFWGSWAHPARAGAGAGQARLGSCCCLGLWPHGNSRGEILTEPGAAWLGTQRCPSQGQTVPWAAQPLPGARWDPVWVTLLCLQPKLFLLGQTLGTAPGELQGRGQRVWHKDTAACRENTGCCSLFGVKLL